MDRVTDTGGRRATRYLREGALIVVDRAEGAEACRRSVVVFSHDDEPGAIGKRIEGLAAERVTLDQAQGEGQGVGYAAEDRDQRARMDAAQLDTR